VAGMTVELLVRPEKLEAGLAIVVEAPAVPAVRIVAAGAIRTETPHVEIVPRVTAVALENRVVEAARGVALLAGHGRVKPEQGEARHVVLEEHLLGPTPLAVAAVAGLSELAPVHVVVAVAAAAKGRKLLPSQRPRMAGIARDLPVGPPQGEALHLVMIEAFGLPGSFTVAALTAIASPPAVDVVGAVAADAVGRELYRVEFPRVTGLTSKRGVRPTERELRIAVVLEASRRPAIGAVTLLAVRAEAPDVDVVDPMTAVAVGRGALELAVRVTQSARCVAMLSLEGEPGGIMVEAHLPPGRLLVTAPTVFAELSGVCVVVPVAGDAGPRGLPELRARGVAALAGHALMSAVQWIIGQPMVEGRLVELDHVGIATLVLAMASAAMRTRHLGRMAVEACLPCEVLSDLDVALEAQRVLGLFLEGGVALPTIALDVGVARDHRTWHQELLEVDRRCPSSSEERHRDDDRCGERAPTRTRPEARCVTHAQYRCAAITWTIVAPTRRKNSGR